MSHRIRIAIVGVGNCASSLLQGIHYYRQHPEIDVGLLHREVGGYGPGDIEVSAAFDIDARKVGHDVASAIFAPPNCTLRFCEEVPPTGVDVKMGAVLDGVADHMSVGNEARRFLVAQREQPRKEDVVEILRRSRTDLLLNYLPVGSQEATCFYAGCALEAGVGFVNNIPVFIASDPQWARRFKERNLPLVGDDVMSQLGATVTHRALTELFASRGAILDRTYQLNIGGNTDFLNMRAEHRLVSKRVSKTEAVQSVARERLPEDSIHVGPSDYVAWQNDRKVCFIRMEGRIFGSVPVEIEMRLAVEDSPNSGGVAIDSIRCAKLALDRGIGGILEGPSAFLCKHPPRSYSNSEARRLTEEFIRGGPSGSASARVP